MVDKKKIMEVMKNEAFARCRYEIYAEIARSQGLHYYGKVLEELAENELSHFREFMRLIKNDSDDMLNNLRTAISDENEESTNIYPGLHEDAMVEKELNMARLFQQIAKIENRHKQKLEQLAKLLEENSVFKRKEKIRWKCRTCGYIHEGFEPPNKCPGCQNSRNFYEPEDFSV